jgi:hypothetical protein
VNLTNRSNFQDDLFELIAKHWPDVNSPTSDPDVVWPGEVLRRAINDATADWCVAGIQQDPSVSPSAVSYSIVTSWIGE